MGYNQAVIKDLMKAYSTDDLANLDDELNRIGAFDDEATNIPQHPLLEQLIPRMHLGEDMREIIRQEIHKRVKRSFSDHEVFGHHVTIKDVNHRMQELYDIFDHMDDHLLGKDVEEVSAFFSSLLEIVSQLCLQHTDGMIVVRTRLQNFFDPASVSQAVPRELMQEVNLLFSPEEVMALHMRLPDIPDDDPFKQLFTTILDQSYNMIRFNEMSGNLMLLMSNYFLTKLKDKGYENDPKVLECKERHTRSKQAFQKALLDLKVLESTINQHIQTRPVLSEFPKYLRLLLQIKAGLTNPSFLERILQSIRNRCGEYALARKTAAFDFNKLPSYQHELHIRQAVVLTVQKDILSYTMKILGNEFACVKQNLERLIQDMEVLSETLDPSSPKYQEILAKKAELQSRVELSRKKVDVVRSQLSLVDVQYKLVKQTIQQYKEQNSSQLSSADLNVPSKIRTILPKHAAQQSKQQRMVMAKKVRQ